MASHADPLIETQQEILSQARAVAQTVGLHRRPDRMVVHVRGDDRQSWLNGQVTSDVRQLAPGQGVYGLATNVKGRILADLWVVDEGEHISLLVPRDASEALLKSFDKYIIMEDVELEPHPDLQVLSLQGPAAAQVVEGLDPQAGHRAACDELGHGGYWVWTEAAQLEALHAELRTRCQALGGGEIGEAGFELARLRMAVPRFGHDFDLQRYPQEAGLEARAVSFQKGCYLGQEVICMLENRGQVSRRMVSLRLEANAAAAPPELPPPGTPLLHDGQEVGVITSAAWDPEAELPGRLLGYVKRALAEPGTDLDAGEARARIETIVGR